MRIVTLSPSTSLNYMYGITIPDSVLVNTATTSTPTTGEDSVPLAMNKKVDLMRLAKLLKMSDKLLMVDLKYEVAGINVKVIDRSDFHSQVPGEFWEHIVDLTDKLSCVKLLAACAKSIALDMRRNADKG